MGDSVMSYSRAIAQALHEEMGRDERVVVVGEDVGGPGGPFGATRGLQETFGPQRVLDTPISEAAIVGLGVGASMTGLRPVVELMFIDFLGLCGDQVVNQAAKMRYMTGGALGVPLTIRTLAGAGLRAGPQHSASLEAWLLHTPGLKVVMPATPADAKGLLKASIRDDDPTVVIEHKALYRRRGEVPAGDDIAALGQARVMREGRHATVVALGQMVWRALEAAEQLATEDIEVTVIDPRTLAPLDGETIVGAVRRTGRLLVVHEAAGPCGFGAELGMQIQEMAFDWLDAPVMRLTPPFTPVPFSPPLEDFYLPSTERIAAAVRTLVGRETHAYT